MSAKSNDLYVVQDGATSLDRVSSRLDAPVGRSETQGRALSQFLLVPSTTQSTPARTPRSNMLDPSTPTPTSRNLSDKSKGKRKAEDIEITPPEQKKDAQRATFAVPESNRSTLLLLRYSVGARTYLITQVKNSLVHHMRPLRTTANAHAYHQPLHFPPPSSRVPALSRARPRAYSRRPKWVSSARGQATQAPASYPLPAHLRVRRPLVRSISSKPPTPL